MKPAPPEWVDAAPPIGTAITLTRRTSDSLGERLFQQLAEDRFRLDASDLGVALELDRVRRDSRGALVGELIVYSELAGAVTFDGVLSAGDLYLTNPKARQERGRLLAGRARSESVDFESLLEELALRVCKLERMGAPSVALRDVAKPVGGGFYEVNGLHLARQHQGIAFGDGATAKSMVLLHLLGTMAQQGIKVALFDWELSAEDHRVRLERLFGFDMPDVRYVQCHRPLVYEVDRLRRITREDGIAFGGFDSIAVASHGKPEDAEVATAYFRAVRSLGIGGLHIAHINKSEAGDQKPFGSSFWHNLARQTWNVKLEDVSGANGERRTVAWLPRKNNLGALGPATGFDLTFTPERITVTETDVAGVEALAVHLPLKERIRRTLAAGPRTIAELAAELDATEDTIRKTTSRATGLFVKLPAMNGPARIALLTRRVA